MTNSRDVVEHVGVVSTYPPRRCGLASFAHDLRSGLAVSAPGWKVDVAAIDRPGIDWGDEVLTVIDRDDADSFRAGADALHRAGVDVVAIQHEYGIFGGSDGDHVLRLTARLTELGLPYVVTLHTVTANPTLGQLRVLRGLCGNAAATTVFTAASRRVLVGAGVVDPERIHIVAHGAPEVLRQRYPGACGPELTTVLAQVGDAPVMTTFGLIGPGKGLDQAIRALPRITDDRGDLRYIIAGATHPEVRRRDGEAYRDHLAELADRCGVSDNVEFVDAFLTEAELAVLLGRTTVFLTPYPGLEQTSSGTLAFALAAGCPIVSTPYQHAVHLLAGQDAASPGVLVPPGRPDAIAAAVVNLLADPDRLAAKRAAAEAIGAQLTWPIVAARFADVIRAAVARTSPTTPVTARATIDLRHLDRLTDDIGIIQFAPNGAADPASGYCVDDAARLAIVAAGAYRTPRTDAWLDTSLRFLHDAVTPYGLHNLRDRSGWRDRPHRGDHVGRAVWAAGVVLAAGPRNSQRHRRLAADLLAACWPLALGTQWLRPTAYALLGLTAAPARPVGATEAIRIGARHLSDALRDAPDRYWFHERLTYDNARLPQALLAAAASLDDRELADRALAALDWYLTRVGLDGEGHLNNVDNRWHPTAFGDEQPLDTAAVVEALVAAWRCTGRDRYARLARRAFDWFHGANRAGRSVYDPATGGCRDGLSATGVSANQGAESTLAYHQAHLALIDAGLFRRYRPDAARTAPAPVRRTPDPVPSIPAARRQP